MPIIHIIPIGDIELDETGDPVWTDGPTYIRQRLSVRFKFWLGEYFLDLRQGIPYRREVFVKNPNIDRIREIFRQVIVTTPGVLRLNTFELNYDPSARRMTFKFHASVEGGEVRVNHDDQDFIISLSSANT